MPHLVERVLDDVGAIFRHFFPGVVLLLAAYVRRPDWFSGVVPSPDSQQLIILATVSLAIGNLAYVFNRYVIIQFAEFVIFLAATSKSKRLRGVRRWFPTDYARAISGEIASFYAKDWNKVRDIVRFRDATTTFLLVTAESCFLAWNPDQEFSVDPTLVWVLRGVGILSLVFAFWGHALARLMVRLNRADLEAAPIKPEERGGAGR